ncbi:RadC family protein [Pedobacter sp. ASV12]|uniref:RadC family protein n=1 Tax=Pedobacter sp. ASV12 TaxID=2795120 RepID=UPI0018ED1834|nr:DNA repair protein RadC [Pedobacter sp. ASV12]
MKKNEQKLGIKAWAEADRPREKLAAKGRKQLTDAELIAILVGSGNKTETAVDLSKRILRFYHNDLARLAKVEIKELSRFNGIGEAKAIAIIAALELGRRRKEAVADRPRKVVSSQDAFAVMQGELSDLPHEEFWILLLNRAHFVIGTQLVSKGGFSGTVVDPKVVFKIAFEHKASSIILAHNHPSGNLKPSASDIEITQKLVAAGLVLELPVIDHLIIADNSFMSLADEGYM